ncbi:MAG: hypothetical protein OEZ32_11765 [Nitrospinota bacterium]|nr:hypothetical protein [Nitrospinota bacterium]
MENDPKNETENLAGEAGAQVEQAQEKEVPFYYRIDLKKDNKPSKPTPEPTTSARLDSFLTKIIIIYGLLFLVINSIAVLTLMKLKYSDLVNESALFHYALRHSLVAVAIFMAISFLLLMRGSAGSWKHFLLSSALAAPLLIYTGYYLVIVLNGTQDESSPIEHIAVVSDKFLAAGNNESTPDYSMVVKPWTPGGKHFTVRIHQGLYKQLEPGVSQVIVYTRQGWLGFEWVEYYDSVQE